MTKKRKRKGTYSTVQKRGSNGERLCFWCEKPVPPPKRSFCTQACVHEWRLRTDSGYVRQCLVIRDKEICVLCKVDCNHLQKKLILLFQTNKDEFLKESRGLKIESRLYKTLWDADHITAVCEGGGESGLDNFRTLCLWCHRQQTNLLLARRAKKKTKV